MLFFKISGIITIIGCFYFLEYNFEKITTYKEGKIIDAELIYVPDCIGKYNYIQFTYNNKTFSKRIGGGLCDKLKEGDTISLVTNKDNSVFLYRFENPYHEVVPIILLLLFGLFLIYFGFRGNCSYTRSRNRRV